MLGGDIVFKPKIVAGSKEDFIFLMSIEDTVRFKPKGDFFGAVAGNVAVELQSKYTLEWTDPSGHDLRFPSEIEKAYLRVASWQRKEQSYHGDQFLLLSPYIELISYNPAKPFGEA